jgi:hypothetical protein
VIDLAFQNAAIAHDEGVALQLRWITRRRELQQFVPRRIARRIENDRDIVHRIHPFLSVGDDAHVCPRVVKQLSCMTVTVGHDKRHFRR